MKTKERRKKLFITATVLAVMAVFTALLLCPALPAQAKKKAPPKGKAAQEGWATETVTVADQQAEAKRRYESAVKLHMSGDLESAIFEYRRAIMLDGAVAAYHADLGEAYRTLNETKLAVEETERAIELDPNLANAYTSLGVIYDSMDLLTKAIENHRKAIKIDPGHYVAYNNLGHTYDRLGLIKAAIANYQKAIDLQYNFSPAYDNLGTDYLNMGDADKGIAMIQKAIYYSAVNDPQLALYYNDLGAAYVMTKEYQRAADAFKRAAGLAPDNEVIMQNYNYIKDFVNGGK